MKRGTRHNLTLKKKTLTNMMERQDMNIGDGGWGKEGARRNSVPGDAVQSF